MSDKPSYEELESQIAGLRRRLRNLQEEEDALNAFFDQSLVMLFIADLQTNKLVRVNKEVVRVTKRSIEDLLSDSFMDFIHPDDRDKSVRVLARLSEGEAVVGFQNRHLTADGDIVFLEWTAVPDSKRSFMYAMAQDVTERRRVEEEREKLQDQLRQAQKMEAVGRLAGGIAHDFNNILGLVIGHADMILEDMDPHQPTYAAITEIKKAGERSAGLVRQLLAFARRQTVMPKVLDINETVSGMIEMLKRLIGEDIELVWAPGKNLWPVKIDPSQVDQILANLCVNARDAIADVGNITIETDNITFDELYCERHPGYAAGNYVMLAVSDDGCGMDSKTLSNVFEPYFTTKEVSKGTGLGLATVYGTVKQNRGFISVYSEPGTGTTFKVYLPRQSKRPLGPQHQPPRRPSRIGHETILLVEDDPMILNIAAMMLQKLGYYVIQTHSPNEAIALAREYDGEIHLLFTDVIMPEMNGRELAENILRYYADVKSLFMSGYTANIIAHHGVLDEDINFIQKPFSIGALRAKVREALEG
jgi:two-component system, cell cycle sensor histidine kinase and response regulator CckA